MKKWYIWGSAALFYAFRYLLCALPNVLKCDFLSEFNMNSSQFGQFSSAWYLGYTVAHIPIGIALDRYGPKLILPISMALCTIGTLPLLFSNEYFYPLIGRFIVGIGSAGATLGMFKIVTIFFEEQLFTRMISLTCVIGVFGAIFANYPLHILLAYFSWKSIIFLFVAMGILLGFLMFFIMPQLKTQPADKPLDIIKILLKNKWLWIISLTAGFFAGPMEGFADAWAMSTLEHVYGATKDFAAKGSSIIYIGFVVGLLSADRLINKIGLDLSISACGIGMLIVFALILLPVNSLVGAFGLLFLLGFFSFYQVSSVKQAIFLFKQDYAALTTACFNMVMMIFGSYFHLIIGSTMNVFSGQQSFKENLIEENIIIYQKGLIIIPAMLFLGIVLSFLVFWRKPKAQSN